jgi:ATP-binding cassette subfamily B protein
LSSEAANATQIIIGQRIASIRDADQILVLDDGAIAGIGTHEDLLAGNATYQEIVSSQLSAAEAS